MGSFDVGFIAPKPDGKKRLSKLGSGTIITPSTSDQAIPQGYYGGVVGDGKVAGSSNLVAGNIKSGVSIFGVTGNLGNFTSIQRGSFQPWNGNTNLTATITISPVNVNNAVVIIKLFPSNPANAASYESCYAQLTASNQITLTRTQGVSLTTTVHWEVIEFNNVMSKQSGLATSDVTIASVNLSKSLIFSSSNSTDTGTGYATKFIGYAYLANASTVSTMKTGTETLAWQVIEFK
jgi:hypothetical protein